ncbi:thrombospondin type-1 domain-containing protein 4-like isoform X1 [Liolophura sinensis]|uniref:thrombospondin type-1 domain-containing protein 4-like isoform X1 n=1 Tax=Liolophura sinensis TaxID=3198878 RepID=UPI0031589981
MENLRVTLIRFLICHLFLLAEPRDQADTTSGHRPEWDSWSNWGTWSSCSQPCGQGLSARSRRCQTSHRTTLNHIGNCHGSYQQYKICEGKKCPNGVLDYRTEQCAKYNHKTYIGRRYDWVPFINPRNQCELSCLARGYKFYAKFAPMVPDGTPCDVGIHEGACVSGKCKRVGCDGIVGSSAANDQCGVCQGDNSTCRIISGIFMRPHLKYGYNTISKIPGGSCNINITEARPSRNYLALQKFGGEYIFNGNWRPSPSGQYKAIGTTFTYSRLRTHLCPGQCIFAHGPTNRTVDLQLLAYQKNPGIHYSFTVPLGMVDKVMADMLSISRTEKSNPRRNQAGFQQQQHSRRHHHGNHRKGHRRHQEGQTAEPVRTPQIQQLSAPEKIDSHPQSQHSPSYGSQALHLAGSTTYRHHSGRQSNQHQSGDPSGHSKYASHSHNTYLPASTGARHHQSSGIRHALGNTRRFEGGNRHSSGSNRHSVFGNRHSTFAHSHSGGSTHRTSSQAYQGSDVRALQYGRQPHYIPPYQTHQQRLAHRHDNRGLIPGRYQPLRYIPPQSPGRQALKINNYPSQSSSSDTNNVSQPGAKSKGQPFIDDALNPQSSAGARIEYTWKIAGFKQCTASCAGGTQETNVVCVKGQSEAVVTDENCVGKSRPPSNIVVCNSQPCPPQWLAKGWGPCSTTCGEGSRTRLVECRKKISSTLSVSVSADLCLDQTRPVSYGQCNNKPCSSWKTENWSKCSTNCGLGQRTREVTCVGATEEKLPVAHCQDAKPPSEEVCDMGSCAKDWFYTRWSKQCSSECGEGFHERKVFCSADDGSNLPESRCPGHKPRSKKHCKQKKPCGGLWFAGPWTGCSATCGIAMRTRDVVCMKRISSTLLSPVKNVNCLAEDRPISEEPCGDLGPCSPEWFMTDWGECSVSCGTGVRTRELKCLYPSLKVSEQCPEKGRPAERQSCNKHSCHRPQLDKDPGCRDKYASFCIMVVQARLCSYDYYKERCCLSCQNHS